MQKLAKIRPEQIVGREFAGDLGEALLSLAQLFGHQLAGALLHQLTLGFVQMASARVERIEMPAARGDRAGVGALKSHALLQMLAQQIDALAGRRGHVQARRLRLFVARALRRPDRSC